MSRSPLRVPTGSRRCRGVSRICPLVWALLVLRVTAPAWAQPAPEREAEPASEAPAEQPAGKGEGAGERTAPRPGVEVFTVIGEAIQGTEFEAPVSVTSFGAEDLAALGVEDVEGIASFTPNLEIRSAGATTPTFFIRGVGLNSFTTNAAGSVAIYQDDVALNLPAIQLVSLFDVDSVEVLRGPQGAGPGRNASAGAIKIYSKKPSGNFEAFLRSDFGRFNSRLFEGALEVPVLDDVLSTRLSFLLSERDPFLKNGCAGAPPRGLDRVVDPERPVQPSICGETLRERIVNPNPTPELPRPFYVVSKLDPGLEEDLNDRFNWGARAHVRLQPPGTDTDWLLSFHGSRVDQFATLGQTIGTQGQIGGEDGFFGGTTSGYRQPEIDAEEEAIFKSLGGPNLPTQEQRDAARSQARRLLGKNLARRLDTEPFRGDYNRAGEESQTSFGGLLRGDLELGLGHVMSLTAYERYERQREIDSDFTPNVIFENVVKDDGWQITQDLRLDGDLADGTFLWNTGGYYLMDHLNYTQDSITGPALIDLTREFEQKTFSMGFYAGFTWDFLDDFTLEGGARYNWERKEFDVSLSRSGGQVCDTPGQDCNLAEVWDEPTGTLSLRYRFLEDVSAYLKYSHGWKGAQYNAGGASGQASTLAEPETIDAWELGLNGSWLDGRATAKASLFYYDYENYQVFITQNDAGTPPQQIVINANDAQVYGAEFEGSVKPARGLTIYARFSWLESEFLDFTNDVFRTIPSPQPPPVIVPITLDYTGNRLPNTPRYKVSLTAEYRLDLGRYGWLVPRYDYVWTDDFFFDPSQGRGAPNSEGRIFMPEFAIGQPAYSLHNARLAWRNPSETIEVAGWVRNLTDQVYKTLAFDASTAANLVGNLVGDPRTYGVSVNFQF